MSIIRVRDFLLIFCSEPNGECFLDNLKKSRVLPHGPMDSDDMTIGKCKKHCIDKNYKYAGVRKARECFCGNDFSPKILFTFEFGCSTPCAGDKSEKCGDGQSINIYHLGNN